MLAIVYDLSIIYVINSINYGCNTGMVYMFVSQVTGCTMVLAWLACTTLTIALLGVSTPKLRAGVERMWTSTSDMFRAHYR